MKKSKRILLRLIPVLLLVVVIFTSKGFVQATSSTSSSGISTNMPTAGNKGITTLDDATKKVWKSVTFIFQILAIAAIIIAGLRYMLSSADQKADIKKSLSILIIGAVLVFAASTIAQIIVNVVNEIK